MLQAPFLFPVLNNSPRTTDDSDANYEMLGSKWETHSEETKQFAEYFKKYKHGDVKKTMLLEHRVSCGIGLKVYTQNASECMNRVIKGSMNVSKMERDQFVEHMRDVS